MPSGLNAVAPASNHVPWNITHASPSTRARPRRANAASRGAPPLSSIRPSTRGRHACHSPRTSRATPRAGPAGDDRDEAGGRADRQRAMPCRAPSSAAGQRTRHRGSGCARCEPTHGQLRFLECTTRFAQSYPRRTRAGTIVTLQETPNRGSDVFRSRADGRAVPARLLGRPAAVLTGQTLQAWMTAVGARPRQHREPRRSASRTR